MHILLVNDDGPPSSQHSPYVHAFIVALRKAGHLVSVVLPHQQRSWIGKAHEIGKILSVSYYHPGAVHKDNGFVSEQPFTDGEESWLLVDGTPASCVQLGLYHLLKNLPPVDLVVSGPNYGRNTTALFVLSSGTLGAAIEGACCGKKSIALSFAFDKKIGDKIPSHIEGACKMSVRLMEKLYEEWPDDVQVYNVNVPLDKGANPEKIVYTDILQNQWSAGTFKEVINTTDAGPGREEAKIRQGEQSIGKDNNDHSSHRPTKYKWAPRFADVFDSSMSAQHGDGYAIYQGYVSVTPLRANFLTVPRKGEIKLTQEATDRSKDVTEGSPQPLYVFVKFATEDYVGPLIRYALGKVFHQNVIFIEDLGDAPAEAPRLLQWAEYEDIAFELSIAHVKTSMTCAYVIRKALIRKHFLSNTVEIWTTKHPDSILASHFKPCIHFELDYVEFLDDALVDAWDLNESLAKNENAKTNDTKEWWILKPSMSDGGNGIRLFSTLDELRSIFEEWEPTEEFEDDDDHSEALGGPETDDGTMTSQLRHFIAQPYIHDPLLLSSLTNRKFHVRTYVLAVGALKVYVYREMLALFAAQPYVAPRTADGSVGPLDLAPHLTNTCFQSEQNRKSSVHRFWSLNDGELPDRWHDKIFDQVCAVTGEVFEAAAREQPIHFQPLPNAFEIFGVDFLVDQDLKVWLLELNAYPDLKQTGEALREEVVGGLLEEVIRVAVQPFFGTIGAQAPTQRKAVEDGKQRMPIVCDIDLGRR